MHTSLFAWLYARLLFLTKSFACRLSKPDIRIFLTLEPQHVRKATTFKDGPFILLEEFAPLMVKSKLDVARSPHGNVSCLARLSQPKHLAFARTRIHSNNTADTVESRSGGARVSEGETSAGWGGKVGEISGPKPPRQVQNVFRFLGLLVFWIDEPKKGASGVTKKDCQWSMGGLHHCVATNYWPLALVLNTSRADVVPVLQ